MSDKTIKNKQKKSVSEASVCRLIFDRHTVMKTQIFNLIMEKAGDDLSDEVKKDIMQHLTALVVGHTDGLVSSVSKQF